MIRKILIATLWAFLAWRSVGHAATYYFSSSTGDNANQGAHSCSQANPCRDFPGTTLDNQGALSCGDRLRLKRGDTWEGTQAEWEVESQGCSGNPIYVEAYGTGANPVLAGAAVTSAGWTVHSGNIYKITGQSQTFLKTVVYTIGGVHKALGYWNGSNTTLPLGTFRREGSTLYVRLFNNENPATSNVRIGNLSHSAGDGSHGLLRGGESENYSSYQVFRDITVIAANGVGFSYNGFGIRTAGLNVVGSGQDNFLCWHLGFLGACSDWGDYYSENSYGAAGVNGGGGSGQGFTSWGGPIGFLTGHYSHHNYMAGIDLLDFSGATNVTEISILRVRSWYNGGAPSDPAYDPNFYSDGASEVFIYGSIFGPRWANVLDRNSVSVKFGSEHPTTKPTENHQFINNLIFGTSWINFYTDEICYGSTSECPPSGDSTPPRKIKNIDFINNTLLAYSGGGFEMNWVFDDINTTTDHMKARNNIFVINNGGYNSYYMNSGAFLDADNNLYYSRTQSASTTDIYSTNGGSEPRYNLSEWRTLTSEDANSAYGNPLLTTDSDTNPVVTLGIGSPAIDTGMEDPYTYASWVPQTIKDDIGTEGLRGSTKSDGTVDDVSTNMDIGFHYDYANLTSVTATPASLTVGNVGNVTFQFTIPDKITAFLYDWQFKATLPAGFILSSGATSAVASSTISGTWNACSVSGQTISCTRAGDAQSELPGTYNVVISNVKNPTSAGTTGTFAVEIHDPAGDPITTITKVSEGTAPAVTISSGSSPVCGNSLIESGESCDDGNTTALDGCSATCQTETPVCGNSIVEYLEQCDDGNTTALDGCSATCQLENPVCGNGAVESGEQCDDNNTNSGDGCDASCQSEATGQVLRGCGFVLSRVSVT